MLANDVHQRNGPGLELHEPGGRLVREVLRDDDAGGALGVTAHHCARVPLPVVEEFLASAAERLSP